MRRFSLDFTRSIRADETSVQLPEGSLEYHVRVGGQSRPEVATLRWDAELLGQLDALRAHADGDVGETAARLGRWLAEFLAVPEWRGPEREIAAAAEREPVALTLRSNAAELYHLPWELLHLDPARRVHAGSLPELLLRYEWPDTATAPRRAGLSQTKPGRVVFAWSAAGGKVDAARHVKLIERALDAGRPFFDDDRTRALDVIENASCEAIHAHLKRAMSRGEPVAVLHLLCHGGRDGEGTFGLALSGADDPGARDLVDPGRLQLLLLRFAGLVRLVVVSACDGGNAGPVGHELGSVAQVLHRGGFPAVIASRLPLSWDGARVFADGLYDGLLRALAPLEGAFLAARERVALRDTYDWASLQLYARAADGHATRVFTVRPYRGLSAYRPEHARFFFGRGAESDELVRELDALVAEGRPRFMVVAGASGTGKSSLVLAGAVPRLLARASERGEGLALVVVRPGAAPVEALERVAAARRALAEGDSLLVVVDQFEELFTHVADPATRASFARALWAWANEPEGAVRVIVTLRIDFLARCSEVVLDEATGRRLDRVALDHAQQVLVAQMDAAQLRDAIEGPAAAVGLALEPGLAERIVRDVGAEPGALPLMSHALHLLWRAREGETLTRAAYEALGAVQGALDRHAEEQLAALADDAEREAARRILVRLVHPGAAGSSDTRRRRAADELRRASRVDPERFDRVLGRLVDARLLVSGEGEAVEIAHEAMFRTWRRLAGWIDEERARLVQVAQVEAWTEEWRRSPDALLAGSRLGYAEEVAGRHPDDVSDEAHALIQASRAEQDRQRDALLDALSRARDNARMSALRDTTNDPTAQVALLREVERPERAPRWEETARALLASPDVAQAVIELEGGAPAWAALSPDGAYLLTRNLGGEATLWRTDGAGEPVNLRSSPLHSVTSATFSPDGVHLLATFESGWTRVWRADGAGEPVALLHPAQQHVYSAAFSPDGTRVVTASFDRTARVWRADGTGEPVVLEGHEGAVTSAVFSPDGGRVLTRSNDATARVYRADGTGQPVVLRGHADFTIPELLRDGKEKAVTSAMFSPDGEYALTSAKDGTARVWRADGTGEPVVLRGHEKAVTSAIFSPDAARVLTRSEDGTARVWRADGAGESRVLRSSDETVTSAAFSPDGRSVLTVSEDDLARVWRVDGTGEPIILRGHRGPIASATFSSDGARVLTASADGTARVWRADGAGEPVVLRCGESPLAFAAFLPDGVHAIAAPHDGTARVWRADGTGEPVILLGRGTNVTSATFSPDGVRVLAASSDGTARVWRADGAGEPVVLRGHGGAVTSAVFSPDGARVLTASADGTARVWRTDGAGELAVLMGHETDVTSAVFSTDGARVLTRTLLGAARLWRTDGLGEPLSLGGAILRSVAFSPDGERVVTASEAHDLATVWRADGRGEPVFLRGHEKGLLSATFSPDGTRVLTSSKDDTARVWRADGEGEPAVLPCPEEFIHSAVFSPDGARALIVSQRKYSNAWVRVWRADGTGEPVVLGGGDRAVKFVGFSPDGARVLGASESGATCVWRADGAGEPVALPLPRFLVTSAAFSPDGAHVLSAFRDGTARVCRTDGSGEPVVLRGHDDPVKFAAFSPDGTRVLTLSADGTIRVWRWQQWRSIPEMLWDATTYCLPVEKRMALLGETGEEAREAHRRAREEVARRAARDTR